MSTHYKAVSERDRKWIMQLDVATMERFAWPLLVGFVCLNFLDVYTTALGMNFGPLFHEENPLAAALFDRQFQGFLLALILKYLPLIPLFYLVFVRYGSGRHQVEIRTLKLAAVVALASADLFLLYVVGINNLQVLLSAG